MKYQHFPGYYGTRKTTRAGKKDRGGTIILITSELSEA